MTKQNILDRILKTSHIAAGLSLKEEEDFLFLYKNGSKVATWSARGATIESIIGTADYHASIGAVTEIELNTLVPGNEPTEIRSN